MPTWHHRRSVRTLTTLVATGVFIVAGTATAHADLVVNGVDDSIDTTIEQMPLSLSTGPGKTTIYVVGGDDDNDAGCNFDAAAETVTVSLVSSDPAVATVSPSSLVLTACGTAGAKEVTVTPVGVGSATVTTTVVTGTNTTKGGFNVQNARFAAKVTAVPNTPPTLDIVGVEEGGTYPRGTLARPECVATDVDDFPTYPHTKTWLAPMTEISGPYAVDNIGTRYAQCSYVDGSGVQVLARKGFSIVDESAPVISRVLSPAADGSGWFRDDVSVDWTVTEAQSPSSLQTSGCEDEAVTADTKLTTIICSATSAGGVNSSTLNIRRDATAPVVSPTTTIAGGGTVVNGWYTSPVDVTFTATDETSSFLVDGRVVGTSSQTVQTSSDGVVAVESPAFTDRAGNSSAVGAQTRTVKVDATAPNAPAASLSTPAPDSGWHTAPVTVTFSPAGDSGSGVASCSPAVTVDVDTTGKTVSGTCKDHAGHVSAAKEVTVKLDRGAPVVMESVVASAPTGDNGWYTTAVDVDFTATDAVSGIDSVTQRVTSSGEGPAVEVSSPAFTDRAGNTTPAGAVTRTFKVDATAPNAPSASLSTPAPASGWHTAPVTVTFEAAGDKGSGVKECTPAVTLDVDTTGRTVSGTCTDHAGHTSAPKEVTVKLDQGAPVVSHSVVTSATLGTNGWYTTDVTLDFTATDAVSGLGIATQRVTTSGEGAAVAISSPAFTDRAGNTTPAGAMPRTFKVDKTAPATPTFVGGPTGSHYFGEVPAAPTCTSTDAGSGVASCVVTGGGSTVGKHVYTATATDQAGHTSTSQLAYEILAWTAKDFTAPVDMGGVFNTVKGGSTVPAKFEIFAGTKELSDTGIVTLSNRKISCTSSAPTDDIESVVSGSTSLRYDTTAGQFQYNWKLPTGAGTCYELKMTAKDGSSVTANFKLK